MDSQKSEIRSRFGLWSNPELREHIHDLLEAPTAIPGFEGYSVHGALSGSALSAEVYFSDERVSSFVIVVEKDDIPSEAFGRLLSKMPSGKSCIEPPAPYCASYVEVTPTHDLLELQWLPDYERCVAWEWIFMRSSLQSEIIAAE